MWTCQKCNSDNPESTAFCQSCGEKKPSPNTTKSNSKSQYSSSYSPSIPQKPNSNTPPKIRFDNYIKENALVNTLNMIGNIYLFVSIILMIAAFFVIGNMGRMGFNFLFGLVGAIAVLAIYIVPGLLLKAMANIWQNTEDTKNLLRLQIDMNIENNG